MVAKLDSKRVNGKASYQPIQEELNDNPYDNEIAAYEEEQAAYDDFIASMDMAED